MEFTFNIAVSYQIHNTVQTPTSQTSNNPSINIRTNHHINITSTQTFTTSISELTKSFDGLDHHYTPEEYLKLIEARVTFSLGIQTTSDHEYEC